MTLGISPKEEKDSEMVFAKSPNQETNASCLGQGDEHEAHMRNLNSV